MVQDAQARDWAQLHGRKDGMYNFDNPHLPTLQPWRVTTAPPATRFVFERNDYFHRVDPAGQQLPYIDRVVFDVVDDKLIPVKTGAGETDLQSRGLFFKHYTFLKESEARSNLDTFLWETAQGAHMAIYPNLNAKDEVWRELFRDALPRALSLGVDRDEINQIMYFASPWRRQHRLPKSPLTSRNIATPGRTTIWSNQRAARRDRPDRTLARRPAPAARWPADGADRRDGGRGDRAVRHPRAGRGSWLQLGIRIHTSRRSGKCFATGCAGEALMSIWYGLRTASLRRK
jgi:peptide/nickel transport system substrate-binding protein